MEDLQKQAIILIYPDGLIEKIPVTYHEFHILYYHEHFNKSVRFNSLCHSLKIDFDNNLAIDKYPDDYETDDIREEVLGILGRNGVLIIENLNIFDIVHNLYLEELCEFIIYFPEYFYSKEQLEAFLNYDNGYPKNLLYIGRFNKKQNLYLDISYEEKQLFISQAKEIYDIRDLKR